VIANRLEPSDTAPRPRLLIRWESRPRVFFSNLADLLLFRQVQQPFLTSRPAAFWPDVFVPTGHPWFSFLESTLGHLLLIILVVWAQSRIWEPVRLFPQRDAFRGSITYTPPAPSFQASEGRVSKKEARSRVKHPSPRRPAMAVKREPAPGLVTPPDLKQAMAASPNLPESHPVTPMAPLSATPGARRNALADSSGVVAPPPQVDQAASRRLGLPQASGVAPAPELGAASARRKLEAGSSGGERIVPPPPSVQSAGNSTRRGGMSSMSGTGTNIVPPPPSVQGTGNGGGDPRLGSMASGSQVVPPPPSLQGGGNSAGTGRGDWPSATGTPVVPPPPSIQSSGGPGGGTRSVGGLGNNSGPGGRAASLSGDGSQIIPPPPSVGGAGNGTGGGGRLGSLSGNGSQVIPPPPSVGSGGNGGNGSGVGGRLGSLSGDGSQVIPPPPSVGGGGGGSGVNGRLGSLSGDGSQVIPPPPSVGGGGGSGAGGRLGGLSGDGPDVGPPSSSSGNGSGAGGTGKLLEPLPADDAASTPAARNESKPAAEEVPLAALGLVFAAPGTSFFSNFEVFVAKRRVAKNQLVLMKLVYEFLPYQRRLSEYHLDDLPPRVIKLKVTPDPSCNETLGHMIEPHPDANARSTESPKLPEELRSADMNAVLPCYRTTADDFQKAMARAR
jgi:hypothetical protein